MGTQAAASGPRPGARAPGLAFRAAAGTLPGMKQTLVAVAVGLVALVGSQSASAEAPRCEHQALVRWAAAFPGSARLKVERTATQTRWLDGKTGEALLEVHCDGLEVPAALGLRAEPAQREQARPAVQNDGVVTLARTGRNAVSLDIAAGALGRLGVHVLIFDDGSFNVGSVAPVPGVVDTRSKAVYAAHVAADGGLVVTEAAAIGCGCERTTTADGVVTQRKLP